MKKILMAAAFVGLGIIALGASPFASILPSQVQTFVPWLMVLAAVGLFIAGYNAFKGRK